MAKQWAYCKTNKYEIGSMLAIKNGKVFIQTPYCITEISLNKFKENFMEYVDE